VWCPELICGHQREHQLPVVRKTAADYMPKSPVLRDPPKLAISGSPYRTERSNNYNLRRSLRLIKNGSEAPAVANTLGPDDQPTGGIGQEGDDDVEEDIDWFLRD
jgi:hypothetical protein